MKVKELINTLLEYPMDSEVYTQREYGHNRYVLVKAAGLVEDRVGVVIQELPDWFEKHHTEDENEKLREENQKLRELLFDPRRITNEVDD